MFQEELSHKQFEQQEDKKFDIEIGFFYDCDSVQEIPKLLVEASKEGSLDTAIFREFSFTVKEILDNKDDLILLAKEKEINFVIAPENENMNNRIQWTEIKKELQQSGISFKESGIAGDYSPEVIGFYFNKNGTVYAFPKVFEKHPVHKIPETNIGITICGEVRHIKPEDLEGIDILYNPSLEGDDLFHQQRLELFARYQKGEKITKEIVEKLLLREKRFHNLLLSDQEYRAKIGGDVPDELIKTEGERKKELDRWVDYLWKPIEDEIETAFDSTYCKNNMKEIGEILKQKKIPVMRCDRSSDCSGLLNPSSGSKVDNIINSEKKFSRMHLL